MMKKPLCFLRNYIQYIKGLVVLSMFIDPWPVTDFGTIVDLFTYSSWGVNKDTFLSYTKERGWQTNISYFFANLKSCFTFCHNHNTLASRLLMSSKCFRDKVLETIWRSLLYLSTLIELGALWGQRCPHRIHLRPLQNSTRGQGASVAGKTSRWDQILFDRLPKTSWQIKICFNWLDWFAWGKLGDFWQVPGLIASPLFTERS
jgi:hypothetical protein